MLIVSRIRMLSSIGRYNVYIIYAKKNYVVGLLTRTRFQSGTLHFVLKLRWCDKWT